MRSVPHEIEKVFDGELDETDIIDIPFHAWRIWFYLDATDVKTNRPGQGPIGHGPGAPRRLGAYAMQKAVYSRYFRACGLKVLSALLPDGMWGAAFVSALSHNDVGTLNMSCMVTYLQSFLEVLPGTNGEMPAGQGDNIFPRSAVIVTAGVGRDALGRRMRSLRQSIELEYGSFFNLFKMFKTSRCFSLYKKGELARRTTVVGFFLHNCYKCFNGGSANSMFDMLPPSLAEYLPLDEDLDRFEHAEINPNYHYYN